MKTLIGGCIGAVLGLIGIIIWFDKFLYVIAGTVPLILILGGGLAIYMGIDEFKEIWEKRKGSDAECHVSSFDMQKEEELERYKEKVENLEKVIEELKKDKKED